MNQKSKFATVLGGSGFIGSHVADELSDAGYQVRIVDRVESKWRRHDQDFQLVDIADPEALLAALDGSDIVYHFAGLSSLDDGQEKALESARQNIIGTLNVLEACRSLPGVRLMFASTLYVYSREGGFYRCSKQAAEQYIEEFSRKYDLSYTIIRYGSLYGPRSDEKNGLHSIVQQALEGDEIVYHGGEDAIREYIHVCDAARASVEAIDPKFIGESLVLTGQEMMKVKDVLEILSEILGRPKKSVKFLGDYAGHYLRTPYAHKSRIGKKYVLPLHVDIGQGLLELVEQITGDRI